MSLPLKPIVVNAPFQQWGLDFIGEINHATSRQHRWILTATNFFIKWLEAIPTKNATDKVIISFIRENILSRFGRPKKLLTDNSKAFKSKSMVSFWLLDSGPSKHMTRFKELFVKLSEHESPHKVKLGCDYQYLVKGSGEASYKLDSRKSMKIKDVLFVPGLKKNLLSISALDAKGIRVAFVYGQVLMWPKGKTIDDAVVIGG